MNETETPENPNSDQPPLMQWQIVAAFWQQAFIKALPIVKNTSQAAKWADDALEEFEKRFNH